MPITLQDIKEHHEQFGIGDFTDMTIEEYRQILNSDALFWVDHHGFVRNTFSEEILATNREQLDAMIYHLQILRDKMAD